MTIHLNIENDKLATKVLMPGDPKRCEYIAKKYLTDYEEINNVRGMLSYTGYYKNQKISLVPSGMGIPSMGIYAYELYNFYNAETIIRIGTSGSMNENIKVGDIVLATESYSQSNYAYLYNQDENKIMLASESINNIIENVAKEKNIAIKKGPIITGDIFDPYEVNQERFKLIANNNFLASEMEAFALFYMGKLLNKKCACLLTVSDSKYENIKLTSEERQNNLDKMIELALNSIINC